MSMPHRSDLPAAREPAIALARERLLQGHSGGLAPWLERSWQRCLQAGLQPQQRVGFDPVGKARMRQVQEANRCLQRAAQPVLQDLARTLADIGFFALLTDAQGVVIDVAGVQDPRPAPVQAIARVGVDLSERAVGTTAIALALAERQPVWLHRGEHFFDDTSVYSCAGAPVFAPDGQCAGMLDLTGVMQPERAGLKHLVRRSARHIENHWLLLAPHRLRLRISWPGSAFGEDSDGLLTLDADGLISGANPGARQMLGLMPGQGPVHASEVFATDWQGLFDAARHPERVQEWPLWSGLRLAVRAETTDRPERAPAALTTAQAARAGADSPSASTLGLRDLETQLIRDAVRQARGNVAEAARQLGISRATVYRKLR